MKHRILAAILVVLATVSAVGCGEKSGYNSSLENQTIDIVKGEETYSAPVAASMPDDVEIPEFYVPVSIPGINEQIFVFMDANGNTQIRTYARQERFENDVYADAKTGFFACELELEENVSPKGPKEYLYPDGNSPIYQLIIKEYAENDLPGSPDRKDVDPAGTNAAKTKLPASYSAGANDQNIFCFESASGALKYCVYGTCNNGQSGFWYCDEKGNVTPGMPMADMDMERAQCTYCDNSGTASENIANMNFLLLFNGDTEIHATQNEE